MYAIYKEAWISALVFRLFLYVAEKPDIFPHSSIGTLALVKTTTKIVVAATTAAPSTGASSEIVTYQPEPRFALRRRRRCRRLSSARSKRISIADFVKFFPPNCSPNVDLLVGTVTLLPTSDMMFIRQQNLCHVHTRCLICNRQTSTQVA